MKNQNFANHVLWVDLIAFLGVLSFGGILITATGMTAASLATTCVALAGLYAAFKPFRLPGDSAHANDSGPKSDDPKSHPHDV
jgi:hypothetical protein